jgi:signal transduction histidine kinase
LRTATFRLAVTYAGFFIAFAALLFAVLDWVTVDHARKQLRGTIRGEWESLAAQEQHSGIRSLIQLIEDRKKGTAHKRFTYNAWDGEGHPLAVNLSQSPPLPGWQERQGAAFAKEQDDDLTTLIYSDRLSDGTILAVGHDTEALSELRETMDVAFGWSAAAATALAVLGGVLVSAGLLRRVDQINLTASRIMSGRLAERVPERGRDDEFDQLARNINAMLDRVGDLMESLKQVSSDIAHDLRTPLSRLRQGLEATRRNASSIEDYQSAVDDAVAKTDGLLETFTALLSIAQIEASGEKMQFRKTDLSEIFCWIAETYGAVAEEGGKTLTTRIDSKVCVWGNRELISQMLVNLVENAITHTPAGSQIEMSLTITARGPMGIVADSGAGIAPGERDAVFRRFYRSDRSRTSPGNGLGLTLVAAVARAHGIEIELEDNGPGLRVLLDFASSCASRHR